MDARDLDDLFRRFAAAADMTALAAFYDRVAPELLLVAAHFGASGADAEDLVQATFVAAIEHAARYDPARPVLPWLLGILVNQARRERRRRGRAPAADRVPASLPVDPADAAAAAEAAAELADRLRALPAGYREAMVLRFVHGLMPVQIAHTLGVPPGTIKTRLRRGTEMLRRALPTGLATAAATVLVPARGLTAIRTVVLDAAARRTAVHASAVLAHAPARVAAPVWIAGACAILAAVGAGLAFRWRSDARGEASAPAPVSSSRAPPEHDPSGAPAPAPLARQPVLSRAEERGLVVEVRRHDGTPAPAVHVAVTPRAGDDPLLRRAWLVADAAGIARADLPPGAYDVVADRGGDTVVAAVGDAPATRVALTLPEGITLRGRVHDAGRALAGVHVWLSFDGRPDEGRCITQTAADGSFALEGIAPGRWFSVFAEGYVPRPIAAVEGRAGEAREVDVDLRDLASTMRVRGYVVDDAGRPVAGARIQLGRRLPHAVRANPGMGRHALVPPIELVTDASGWFSRHGFVVYDRELEAWVRAPGFAFLAAVVRFPGTEQREVRWTLARGVAVQGRATHADGTPASDARVAARPVAMDDVEHAPRWAAAETAAGADGTFTLPAAPSGPILLSATAAAGASAHAVREGPCTWEPVLVVPVGIAGEVVDDRGAPVGGVAVRATAHGRKAAPTIATTGESGAFAFPDAGEGPYTIAVAHPGPWSGTLTARRGVRAGDGRVTLVVPRALLGSGALCGRIVDRDGAPVAAKIAVGHHRAGLAFAVSDPTTGRFRVGPLPALSAAWYVLVEDEAKRTAVRDGLAVGESGDVDLGDLVVEPPGRLKVTVETEPGATIAPGAAYVRFTRPSGFVGQSFPLVDGKAVSRPLPPGPWRVHVVGSEVAQAPHAVELSAGRTVEVTLRGFPAYPRRFRFSHRDEDDLIRIGLFWHDAAGNVLCADLVAWPMAASAGVTQAFAPGSYRVVALSHTGRRGEAAFTVGPGADVAPVEVEMR